MNFSSDDFSLNTFYLDISIIACNSYGNNLFLFRNLILITLVNFCFLLRGFVLGSI